MLHAERGSTHTNGTEAEVIEAIMHAAGPLDGDSVAIVTPHRAQRNLLQQRLAPLYGSGRPIGVIDTVERLQGGERPTIIVSATESDPASIASRVEFILSLNRSNVAFSRASERLIVICGESLLDHIPAEVEHYDSTMLWKSLREYCSEEVGTAVVGDTTVIIRTPPLGVAVRDAESDGVAAGA